MRGPVGRIAGHLLHDLRLIVEGHILNPVWSVRDVRRKKRDKATLRAATKYLKRYIPVIRDSSPECISLSDIEPERVFSIWFQGEAQAPPLVKACFRSMRRNLTGEVIILDEKNLFEWISLPDYIVRKWKEGKIPNAHFSDICRVELLYRHGGLWFDATDYVTSPVPREIIDADFFMFMAGEKVRFAYSFVQNCFIRSKKGNPLLGIWREAIRAYWKEENSRIDYFVHQLLFRISVENNAIAAEYFARMPKIPQDATHALWREYADRPYDGNEFNWIISGSFFQKTNYKDKRLKEIAPGSVAEHIINS